VGSWRSWVSKVLHHYTSAAGLAGILKSKSIFPSTRANNPKDARFGDGQYLSDILPGTKRPAELSAAFVRIPWAGRKFTHYVSIDVTGLKVISCRPFVFVIRNKAPLDISKRLVAHGKI
jgi:hypothetical protein